VTESSGKIKRRRWPWVVGILALVVVLVVVASFLLPRRPSAPAYLTSTVASQSVVLTAQGTGTVVYAEVDSIASDNSWVVSSRNGVATGSTVQAASFSVDRVKVKVGDSVEKNQQLAVLVDENDDLFSISASHAGVILSITRGSSASNEYITIGVAGMRVAADISEYDIGDVVPAQAVDFAFDGLGTTGKGTVSGVLPAPATDSQSDAPGVTEYPVVARISEAPPGLRIGMTVQMTIDVQRVDDVLAVPVQALTEDADGGYTVLVVGTGGRAQKVAVETGLIGDSYAEITGGLSAGDEVVIGTPGASTAATPSGFGGPRTGSTP
jgi:multidrug efflux pump subunit AcrA (membrane-fusion protein)